MARLQIHFPDGREQSERLASQALTFGRQGDNGLVLEARGISRRHGRFYRDDHGRWWIEDVGSTNGILVNGRFTTQHLLSGGDECQIGAVKIVFLADPTDTPACAPSTVTISDTPRPGASTLERSASSLSVMDTGRLTALCDIARSLVGQRDMTGLIDEASRALVSTVGARVVVLGLTCDPERDSDWLIVRPESVQKTQVVLSRSVLRRTIDARQGILIRDTSSDLDIARAESIVMGGIHTAMCVPMMRDEAVSGFIYMDNHRGGRPYSEGDLQFVYAVGAIVGTAIENARLHEAELVKQRMEAELVSARRVQQSIMPTDWPLVSGWEICGYHAPCREVGGDYYDAVISADGRIWLVVADVSGKGAPAALLASVVYAAVHGLVDQVSTPSELLGHINGLLLRRDLGSLFVTCLVMAVEPDTGAALLASAGHMPPILIRPGARSQPLTVKTGLILGVQEGERFVDTPWTFSDQDATLLYYTDGVTEASDPQGHLFKEERLLQAADACSAAAGPEIISRVRAAVADFQGSAPAADDMTLLLIRKV
jgi:serine phosphatase RsbU (regulator of sigma subunit)